MKRVAVLVTLAVALLLAGALPSDPASASGAASLAAAPARKPAEYGVDALHSTVLFRVRHLDVSNFYGVFRQVEGSLALSEEDPASCSVSIDVRADSVDSRNADRDAHLKGPDFFNAKEFPTLSFRSKVVKGAGKGRFEVEGELSVRGQTKALTIMVEKVGEADTPFQDHRAGFETSFSVNLADFRMPALEKMDETMLGRAVHMTISLECIRS